MNLEWLIFASGVLHFGTLLASAAAPRVLNWRVELLKLDRLSRQVIWVHGAFLALVILAFGLVTTMFAADLAAGSPLARGICGFIALFWGARLMIQFVMFDATPFLRTALLKAGYHGLTLVFIYQTLALSWAAIH